MPNSLNYAQAIVAGNYDEIKQISQNLSDENAVFEPISKISKAQGVILDKIKLLMLLIGLVILFITSICINTSLSAILFARIKEFALLRAIGASRDNLLKMILAEILTICVIGSVLGALLGYFLANLLGFLIFSSGVDFRFVGLLSAVILSLIFALGASYYPIKRALNPNLANLLKE